MCVCVVLQTETLHICNNFNTFPYAYNRQKVVFTVLRYPSCRKYNCYLHIAYIYIIYYVFQSRYVLRCIIA